MRALLKPAAVRPLCSLALASLAVLLEPRDAEACGGTFCDNGPSVMPVDQSGENILFWIDDSGGSPHTEAHIQIQYEGDAEQFAWLVPVSQVPEVLVGSQALFDNLLTATGPTITLNTRFDGDCGGAGFGGGIGCAFGDDVADIGFGTFGDDETGGFGGDGDGPDILDRGFAGAFEYVVLTADSVDVIVDWLDANGYAQDSDAPPILAEYLQEDFVFVAFKLRGGVGVDEIHPLAIRYPGVEPCIPIRLTRIAATEDMAIRAFFLGHNRVVPQNWPHVELNLSKLDWLNNPAIDYLELVSLAVDEAGGRAFVTEYAGTDAIVSLVGVDDTRWTSAAFEGVEPIDVVPILSNQGLLACDAAFGCNATHPQVMPLLDRYLPVPANVDPAAFYSCVECYADLVDPVAWAQQPGFAAEYAERISGPGDHAMQMLLDADYLTRLFTLLSPHEMIEDPLFHETESLGTVDNNIVATQVLPCDDSPTYVELPGDRKVALDFGGYPQFADMPSAERIERVPMVGPAQVEADNTSEIDDIIDQYNAGKLVGPTPWNCTLTRVRGEALLAMLALFGIVWFQRAPRRRT